MSEQENTQNTEEPPKVEEPSETEETKKKEESQKSSDIPEISETKELINIKISQNVYQEFISFKEKNIYLITESLEEKIPEILSFLMENGEEYSTEKKIQVLIYLQDLFKKVDFNSEIFSKKKSLKENMNLFEIVINQYITNESKEYLSELKNIFILLINKISLDKKTYKYFFSFFIDYLNKKQKLNSENIFKTLELLTIYYTTLPQIKEKDDYIYFNDMLKEGKNSDYLIKIQNKENTSFKKILTFNLDESLNILFFFKLIPQEIIKPIQPNNLIVLLELDFIDKKNNFSLNLDNENNLFINNATTKEKISKLEVNKNISILLRFNYKENSKTEIYINAKKVEIKSDQFEIKEKEKIKEKYEINSINFFKNFVGYCTNIILFKNKKIEGLPKFFTTKQNVEITEKPKATSISALFDMPVEKKFREEIVVTKNLVKGLFNEDLLNILLKQELKEEVEQNYINNIFLNKIQDKTPLNDIKEIYDKIISIYTPFRHEKINDEIILIDSISNLDVVFNIKNNLNGIHIYNPSLEDFNNIGGLNHFIPIVELMLNEENLLTSENLLSFLNLLSVILIPYYKNYLNNENNYYFFSSLSIFLEKIDDKFFSSDIVECLVNMSIKLLEQLSDDNFKEIDQNFQSYILFDEKLLFKYKSQDQKKILDQIRTVLNLYFLKKTDFVNIDIIKIINIMLYYDKEHYTKYCCKKHSEYFNDSNKVKEIMEPELSKTIQTLEYILKLIFKKYSDEPIRDIKIGLSKTGKEILNLFGVLTLGVSPCLQKGIIKLFIDFFEDNIDQAYKYANLLDKDGIIFEICLFVLKSSIFDNKCDIINFINLLLRIKFNLNSKNKGKDKEILSSVKSSGVYEVFMKNYILPFYLIPKEELKDVDENKIIKSYYGAGGIEFNYLTKTETENKIYLNYNKKKINSLMLDLYKNIFSAFKLNPLISINLNFLIKISSKGDLNLIEKFLQDLTKEKEIMKELKNNNVILNYLLETYFQVFMIKATNYDKSKFISRFYYLNENEEEMKKKIEEINKLSKNLINDIFMINVYRLDYLLTWAKYYFEISKNKSKITKELLEEFIYNIISELDKKLFKKEIILYDMIGRVMESMYFINIIYELITFFKINVIKGDNTEKINLIEEKSIWDNLYSSYDSILFDKDQISQKNISNKVKWKYYPFFKKIYTYFTPLWNKVIKDENEIQIFIENKKNINYYISEFEPLFYEIGEIHFISPEFEKQNTINRGFKLIYILFHFFIQLINLGGDKEDIKETFTTFRSFLTMVILASCTLSTNIDKKKRTWPKPNNYKNAQIIVKNSMYHIFFFFYKTIQKYNDNALNNAKDKNYFLYVKNYLYTTFAYLLSVTNKIYRKTKQEEEKKEKKSGVKGFFSKVKTFFTEGEGVKTSGIYALYEKMYVVLDLDTDYDIKNYFDKIPRVDFNISEKNINPKIIECINAFIADAKNKKFFDLNDSIHYDEEIDVKKLYPFVDYIKKRNLSLNNFIPLYNTLPNVEFDVSEEKNCFLKKLYLVCDYLQKCPYENDLEKNIKIINDNLNQKLLVNMRKGDMEKKTKMHLYIKQKKKLFSFLGLWSNEEYFYNKTKYEIKYKLVNHFTNDYTKVLFEPIINLDYYLPEFTKYNYEEIFRKEKNKEIINNLADLSFAVPEHKKPLIEEKDEDDDEEKKDEEKKEEIKEEKKEEKKEELNNNNTNNNYNEFYDVKLNYYNNLENITLNKDLSSIKISQKLLNEYIIDKYSYNYFSQYDTQVDACLINTALHITGFLYNDQNGIGFYAYEKSHSKEIFEENYDTERFTCFGSIFRPNDKKYKNYYLNIPYNTIELILKRRYFYRRNALEIFTVDKKSYLFNINDNKFKAIYDNIKHYMKSNIEEIYIDNKFGEKLGFYTKKTFLISNSGFIPFESGPKDLSLKSLYENWSKWKISSLKLLMFLNLYASRSFHDLMQYPVFPWIITDYQSKKLPALESQDSTIIRQFDTPMGMMDITPDAEERKNNYIETWNSEGNDGDEEGNFSRYRSHYSTSLYSTYYLVRVFPFSYIRVELQGKNFDDPNRLFNSVYHSFENAITQKSDVRELIPEFFYFPEMFYNYNNLNLGSLSDQNGSRLCNDVTLPEWAEDSGYLFISKHKEMLESPEVSEKINDWINIIFGYKQKGKEAKKINNLFMQESYEDYEEEYKKADEERKIYLCKLLEFGVTPSQLFKSDLNKRMAYSEFKNNRQLLPNTTEYIKNQENIVNENNIDIAKELTIEEAKYQIHDIPYKLGYSEGIKGKYRISALTQDKIKAFKRITRKIQIKKSVALKPNNEQTATTPITDPNSISENKDEEKEIVEIDIQPKREIKLTSTKNRINKPPSVFYNNGKIVVLGGYWNGIILVQNIEETTDEKKIKNKNTVLFCTRENSPIVKIVISKNEIYAVCGNALGNIFVFIINQNNKLEWTFYKKIVAHRDEISCLDINEDLNIIISCSKDGYWFTHSLPNCTLVNSFKFSENNFSNKNLIDKVYYPKIVLISYSPLPCVVFYFEERQSLCVFSINGKLIKEEIIGFKLKENGIKKYIDMQFNEYLLIYNEINQCIEIYNIVELKSLISLPKIEHTFVDFLVGKDFDHIIVLVKFKEKDEEKITKKTAYKIFIIRNNNLEIDWK